MYNLSELIFLVTFVRLVRVRRPQRSCPHVFESTIDLEFLILFTYRMMCVMAVVQEMVLVIPSKFFILLLYHNVRVISFQTRM